LDLLTLSRCKFHLEFIAGIPKGQGFRNIHVEHLLSTKDNEGAILAAVDILGINERLHQRAAYSKFEHSHQVFLFTLLESKNVFQKKLILCYERLWHQWVS